MAFSRELRISYVALVVVAFVYVRAYACIYGSGMIHNINRETPYLVSVNDKCSGAVIGKRFVLTSAHCVEKKAG